MSYIVKEDLLEELGISTDCSTCPRYAGECRGHLSWLCGKIDRMPTHDVVRCKECRYCDDTQWWCKWMARYITSDNYCFMGRKERE